MFSTLWLYFFHLLLFIVLTKGNCYRSSCIELVQIIATFRSNYKLSNDLQAAYQVAQRIYASMKIQFIYLNKHLFKKPTVSIFMKKKKINMNSSLNIRRMKAVYKRYHAANWTLNHQIYRMKRQCGGVTTLYIRHTRFMECAIYPKRF